jgi:hypothetical protein
MGGAIGTRIAEKANVKTMYQGILAIGAALLVKPDDDKLQLKYRPTIPIVYLTNSSETGPIQSYIDRVKIEAEADVRAGAGGDEAIVPALHQVLREGHNWTNARERWRGFASLVEWAFVGSLVTEYTAEVTRRGLAKPQEQNEFLEFKGTRALKGAVLETTKVDSEMQTSLTLDELYRASVRLMSKFKIANSDGVELEVTLGSYPFVGIPDSETVACEDPEG